MTGLGVELRRHGSRREASCVICGGLYQQECVAAVLGRNGVSLGEVCPQCLGMRPRLAGRRLRKRAGRMAERARSVRQRADCPGLAETVLDFARGLDYLAEQLPEAWGVTPEDLRRSEKSVLQERIPQLSDSVLSELVEGRPCYQGRETPTPASQGV
jgi:hypothetical protein